MYLQQVDWVHPFEASSVVVEGAAVVEIEHPPVGVCYVDGRVEGEATG